MGPQPWGSAKHRLTEQQLQRAVLISPGLDPSHCEGISEISITKSLPVFNEHIKPKFSKVCDLSLFGQIFMGMTSTQTLMHRQMP